MGATSVATTKSSTASKTVTPLFRCLVKSTNAVIYRVRNGENREYLVTLNADGTTACTQCLQDKDGKAFDQACPSSKGSRKCYHIRDCQKREDARVGIWYADTSAEGVNPDHAYEKAQRYVKAADLGLSVVEYLHSLRVVVPATDMIVSEECPSSEVALSPEQYQEEQHAAAPLDVVSGEIAVEENPFAEIPQTVLVASHDHLQIGDRLPVEDGTVYEVVEEARPLTVGTGDMWQTKAKLVEELPELPQVEEVAISAEPLEDEELAETPQKSYAERLQMATPEERREIWKRVEQDRRIRDKAAAMEYWTKAQELRAS